MYVTSHAKTSSGWISVIPANETSASATGAPKASRARIAIFAAASAPPTSLEGSASA